MTHPNQEPAIVTHLQSTQTNIAWRLNASTKPSSTPFIQSMCITHEENDDVYEDGNVFKSEDPCFRMPSTGTKDNIKLSNIIVGYSIMHVHEVLEAIEVKQTLEVEEFKFDGVMALLFISADVTELPYRTSTG